MRLYFISFLVFVFCVVPQAGRAQEQADFDCSTIKPFETKINITYETVDPVYDLELTMAELNDGNALERKEQWLRKNGMETLWTADNMVTQGLASGAWAFYIDGGMRSKNVDWMGAYHCAFFEEIEIGVFYRTIIYIPTEFPSDSCKFKVLHKHEHSHHQTNQDVVDKYVAQLEADIRKMIPYMEQKPSGSHRIQERFSSMKKGLDDAIRVYLKEAMVKEMEELNDEIDSPDSYKEVDRLMHLCDVRDEYYRRKALVDAHKKQQRQNPQVVND